MKRYVETRNISAYQGSSYGISLLSPLAAAFPLDVELDMMEENIVAVSLATRDASMGV